ncbi:MAG: hypothetical protein LPH21_19565 [Shewanella sp.]|nr:hypothetical protein [Shewanella sp.]MCF1459661.1 hypothetical protein [Shewanella sp.]
MNIHNSSIVTVFLGCVFATQAYASNKLEPVVQPCDDLYVHISTPILDDYILSKEGIVMNHGHFHGCLVRNNMLHCQFEQTGFYGPDASLSFKRKTDGQIATIRVQQNLCFWEAGNITVEPIRGKWVYSTLEGSYGDILPGHVWLEKVSLNN